ncbi:MAG: class I SAM-dependent methyltransferase [Alphaproteobacteria bacterium]|nr:class I SAM-dependent methyltransferase [Alphaproteobacteria bacterium]
MRKGINFDEAVLNYAVEAGVREHPVLARCRADTAALGRAAMMQIAPEQGAFMAMIARLMGVKRAIEVGTFTGYSALSVALALPEDGHVDALDVSADYMAMAQGYWKAAGQAHKIAGHVGPGSETLARFVREGRAGTYDFGFIDADKTSYDTYYEALLKLVRPGGLIAIDNVLWSGQVCDPADMSVETVALRALNAKIAKDARVDTVLLPIADGIFMCRRR